jgi:hypothetical protein
MDKIRKFNKELMDASGRFPNILHSGQIVLTFFYLARRGCWLGERRFLQDSHPPQGIIITFLMIRLLRSNFSMFHFRLKDRTGKQDG